MVYSSLDARNYVRVITLTNPGGGGLGVGGVWNLAQAAATDTAKGVGRGGGWVLSSCEGNQLSALWTATLALHAHALERCSRVEECLLTVQYDLAGSGKSDSDFSSSSGCVGRGGERGGWEHWSYLEDFNIGIGSFVDQ